jgi:hypothetical protein
MEFESDGNNRASSTKNEDCNATLCAPAHMAGSLAVSGRSTMTISTMTARDIVLALAGASLQIMRCLLLPPRCGPQQERFSWNGAVYSCSSASQ